MPVPDLSVFSLGGWDSEVGVSAEARFGAGVVADPHSVHTPGEGGGPSEPDSFQEAER